MVSGTSTVPGTVACSLLGNTYRTNRYQVVPGTVLPGKVDILKRT